jgi:hypothetical protein
MNRSFKLALITLGFLTVSAIVWLLKPFKTGPDFSFLLPESFERDQQSVATDTQHPSDSASSTQEPAEPSEEVSPLAAELNSLRFPPQHDVDTLHTLLRQYLRRLGNRQGLPLGNDSDLADALKGNNPMKYATLPKNHPAFAPNGRLCDRWGSPYFVHPLAEADFEIRSAGPDRKMFTSDDLVANPAGGEAR